MTRAGRHLFEIEALDRLGVVAVRQPQQEARQSEAKISGLRQAAQRLPALVAFGIGVGLPLPRIGRRGERSAAQDAGMSRSEKRSAGLPGDRAEAREQFHVLWG